MMSTSTARVLPAPENLGLDSRVEFRNQAMDSLEALPEGDGHLIIDFTRSTTIDSAGLGALMLIQRRAAERRQRVILRNTSEELKFLLTLTKLEKLFEFDRERH